MRKQLDIQDLDTKIYIMQEKIKNIELHLIHMKADLFAMKELVFDEEEHRAMELIGRNF